MKQDERLDADDGWKTGLSRWTGTYISICQPTSSPTVAHGRKLKFRYHLYVPNAGTKMRHRYAMNNASECFPLLRVICGCWNHLTSSTSALLRTLYRSGGKRVVGRNPTRCSRLFKTCTLPRCGKMMIHIVWNCYSPAGRNNARSGHLQKEEGEKEAITTEHMYYHHNMFT